jgi:hypothetical protein
VDFYADATLDTTPGSPLGQWVSDLRNRDLKPTFVLLQETDDPNAKRHWLQALRENGCDLLNVRG